MATVLIVEDYLPLEQLYTRFLTSMGATVTHTTTIKQAIAHLNSGGIPDIIILDMALPDGSGLSVAQHLRGLSPAGRTHVIAVSSDDAYARDVRENGIQHFFCKPVQLPSLMACINRILGEHAAVPLTPDVSVTGELGWAS